MSHRAPIFLLALTLPASALGQSLTATAVEVLCPGAFELDYEGGTAGANKYFLASDGVGAASVPGSACAGALTELAAPMDYFGPFPSPDGHLRLSIDVPDGACGKTLQVLDMGDCSLSGSARLNHSLADAAHCYSFDDDVFDAAGAVDAGLVGGTMFVDGHLGRAVQLDGVSGYAELSPMDRPEDFSVAGWLHLDESPGWWARFFEFGEDVVEPAWGTRFVTLDDGLGVAARSWYNTSMTTTDSVDYLPVRTWVHIAYTYDQDGAGVALYLDGVEVASSSVDSHGPNDWASDQALRLGKSFWPMDPGRFLAGTFDEIFLYERALSAAEVSVLYRDGAGLSCSDVLGK